MMNSESFLYQFPHLKTWTGESHMHEARHRLSHSILKSISTELWIKYNELRLLKYLHHLVSTESTYKIYFTEINQLFLLIKCTPPFDEKLQDVETLSEVQRKHILHL